MAIYTIRVMLGGLKTGDSHYPLDGSGVGRREPFRPLHLGVDGMAQKLKNSAGNESSGEICPDEKL
jgi:hypothetical protein